MPGQVLPLDDAETLEELAKYLEEAMLAALKEVCPMPEAKPPKQNRWWAPHLHRMRDAVK